MSRLSLSDSDRMSRNWFIETTKSLNCNVQVDAMVRITIVSPSLRVNLRQPRSQRAIYLRSGRVGSRDHPPVLAHI